MAASFWHPSAGRAYEGGAGATPVVMSGSGWSYKAPEPNSP